MEGSPTTPRRRWLQFSLGSLLLIVALIAVSAFAISEHREKRRLEDANESQLESLISAAAIIDRQQAALKEAMVLNDTAVGKFAEQLKELQAANQKAITDLMAEFKKQTEGALEDPPKQ